MSLALLFPMERIFEDYVGTLFKRHFNKIMDISLQNKQNFLVENHCNQPRFKLKPDIVAREKNNSGIIILDTKWKLINQNKSSDRYNYDISQPDMYQMFTYGKKYKKVKKLFLLYPESDDFNSPLPEFLYHESEDVMRLYACPVRLPLSGKDENSSLKCIECLLSEQYQGK